MERIVTLIICLILAATAAIVMAQEEDCGLTSEVRENLLSLSYKEFDQSLDGGWRTYANKSCYLPVAKLIDEYAAIHGEGLETWERGTLVWHAGQMYAFENEYALARKRFLGSLNPNEPEDTHILWNDYVYASVAFLDGDIEEMKRRRDKIANGPEFNGEKANLHNVENFLKCPELSYAQAYSGCIE